ncbi:hypothetical protein [Thiothrix lacustris]|uniref:hypothetical protein n=1 Tax=Thiothrix lacustris TaxID=525917 RepID=UPI00355BC73C
MEAWISVLEASYLVVRLQPWYRNFSWFTAGNRRNNGQWRKLCRGGIWRDYATNAIPAHKAAM